MKNFSLGDYVFCMSVAPDCNTIAAAIPGALAIWKITDGWPAKTMLPLHTTINDNDRVKVLPAKLVFSPSGQYLALSDVHGGIELWNIRNKNKMKSPRQAQLLSKILDNPVAFTCDDRYLVFGDIDYSICLWDIKNNRLRSRLRGHDKPLTTLAVSPDGKMIASCGEDQTIRFWEVESSQERQCIKTANICRNITFSKRSPIVVWADVTGNVTVANLPTVRPICAFPCSMGPVLDLALCPDDTLLTVGEQVAVQFWNISNGKNTNGSVGHTAPIKAIAVAPNLKQFASGGIDCSLRIWDIATTKVLRSMHGHSAPIECIAFSPNGSLLVSASRDKTVRIWEAATGNNILTFKLEGAATALGFCENGTMVVSYSRDGFIYAWQTVDGKRLFQIKTKPGCVNVACQPNGSELAIAYQSSIEFIDWRTKKRIREIDCADCVRAIAWSPNGKMLAAVRGFDTFLPMHVFDLESGRRTSPKMPRWEWSVTPCSICFSADGNQVVCGTEDGRILVARSLEQEFNTVLNSDAGAILALCPIGQSRRFLTGNSNGTALVWDLDNSR
jgi:WD40 repeat protein